MPDHTQARIDELRVFIQGEIQRNWAENGGPLLLSDLGNIVRKQRPELTDVFPDGLRRFLANWNIAQFVEHPTQEQKIGAIPLGVAMSASSLSAFEQKRSPRHPKLLRSFWSAFHSPPSERRFVVLGGDIPVRIIEAPAQPPETIRAFEILPTDIVDQTLTLLPEKVKATWTKIEQWIQRNQLDIGIFEERGMSRLHPIRDLERQISPLDFAEAFSMLTPQDQARIFIPLDIVGKMLSQR